MTEVVSLGYAAYFQTTGKSRPHLATSACAGSMNPPRRRAEPSFALLISPPDPGISTNRPAIPAVVTTLLATKGLTSIFNGAWQFRMRITQPRRERGKLNVLRASAWPLRSRSVGVDSATPLYGTVATLATLGDFVEQYRATRPRRLSPPPHGVPQHLSHPFQRQPGATTDGKSLVSTPTSQQFHAGCAGAAAAVNVASHLLSKTDLGRACST